MTVLRNRKLIGTALALLIGAVGPPAGPALSGELAGEPPAVPSTQPLTA